MEKINFDKNYKKNEFWKTWNKENYNEVKKKTDPNNIFRDLYTKMCKTTQGRT